MKCLNTILIRLKTTRFTEPIEIGLFSNSSTHCVSDQNKVIEILDHLNLCEQRKRYILTTFNRINRSIN